MPRIEAASRGVAITIILGTSIGLCVFFLGGGVALHLTSPAHAGDWNAYWDAAWRLRLGQPLYPPVADPASETTFRYAPWFAFAWIPLTFLPRDVVGVAWVLAMVAAAVLCVLPLLRSRRVEAVLLAGLFAPYLAQAAGQGNVQPAVVAMLVYGVDRRSGPLAVGVAASLKLFPILYAGHFALRREWGRFAIAMAVTAVLVAPMALFDLAHYPLGAGPTGSLLALGPMPWVAGVLVGVTAAVRLARTRAGWFSTSLAVVLATPRLLQYDPTFLLVTGPDLFAKSASPNGQQASVAS